MLSRCFHCARFESKYWNSVSTFGAHLHFQYHRCEEIVYFSTDFSTTFIQFIQRNEVTSGQQVLSRYFHCARRESMYWISVYTFGARLQYQYHTCEEIVYFSRDFSTTFIQYNQRNEVTSGQQVLYRCFHCARLNRSGLKFSTSIQVLHNESIGITPVGPMWLRYVGWIEWK